MGYSTIGGFIILFFAVLIVASSFVMIYGRMVESTSLTYDMQRERLENEVKTRMEIINISYDNGPSPDTTTAFVRNTGSNKIDIDFLEVFVDQIRIPRDSSNRTISFAPGSAAVNPLHWDPGEDIIIEIYLDLVNVTHVLTITTEHGTRDSRAFLG